MGACWIADGRVPHTRCALRNRHPAIRNPARGSAFAGMYFYADRTPTPRDVSGVSGGDFAKRSAYEPPDTPLTDRDSQNHQE